MTDCLQKWSALNLENGVPATALQLLEVAGTLELAGHQSEAAQAFSRAFELDAGCPEACFGLARLLKTAGHIEPAEELRLLGLDLSRARTRAEDAGENSALQNCVWVWVGKNLGENADTQANRLIQDSTGQWKVETLDFPQVLPKIWNEVLHSNRGADWVVFAGANSRIETDGLAEILRRTRSELGADMVGIAGGSQPAVSSPAIWTAMCLPESRLGSLAFISLSGEVITHTLGATTGLVDLLDEAFLAIHLPSCLGAGWSFNEEFPMHHCVAASCIDARLLGLRLAVAPVECVQSPSPALGMSGEHWAVSEERFIGRYAESSRSSVKDPAK
jgi:hypothetical protein